MDTIDRSAKCANCGLTFGLLDLNSAGWCTTCEIAHLIRESDEARAEVERLRLSLVCLRDAAVWVLNVAHGVGKGGDAPQDGEYTEALTQLAMAVSSAVPEAGEPEGRDEG